jgi:hypothetical protein
VSAVAGVQSVIAHPFESFDKVLATVDAAIVVAAAIEAAV